MLTRGGLPQQQPQLNRQLYPGQMSGQMSAQMGGQMGGQLGGRATPPVGLQPPFQGLAERALAGMEPFNNAQPKPQATTQQVLGLSVRISDEEQTVTVLSLTISRAA